MLGAGFAVLAGCDEPLPPFVPPDGGWADAASGDAGVAGDGGTGGPDAGDPGCAVAIRDLLDDPVGDGLAFDVAGGASGFEVVYTERRTSADPTRNAYAVRVSFDADASPPVAMLAPGDEQLVGEPFVIRSGSGFVAAWSQTFGEAYELATARIDAAGARIGSVRNTTLTPDVADVHPVLVGLDGGSFLGAYVAQSFSMGMLVEVPTMVLFDADGAPTSAALPVSGMGDVRGTLRLHVLGGAAMLGWRDSTSVFRLAPLAADGTLGSVRTVSQGLPVAEDFDFHGDSEGGVAVYDVSLSPSRPTLRLRVLDRDGRVDGDERELLEGARRGAAPALAAGPEGYVVAYRGSDDGTSWSLRLAFVDRATHAIVSDRALAPLVRRSGRVRLAVEPGGRMLVVWDDVGGTESGVRLRAARIDCR